MLRFKELLSALSLPLFALAALVAFYVVWGLFDLPPREEVVVLLKQYYAKYGLLTIFVSALLEGVLFAGWYFPGSLVIVLGVVFAGGDLWQVGRVVLVTTCGFSLSHIFNFYVGRYGWYKLLMVLGLEESIENAKRQLVQYGPRAIFFTYWHPNLAALSATASGILDMPFRVFAPITIAATLFWGVVWASMLFVLGEASTTVIGPQFALAFIGVWMVIILFRHGRKSTA